MTPKRAVKSLYPKIDMISVSRFNKMTRTMILIVLMIRTYSIRLWKKSSGDILYFQINITWSSGSVSKLQNKCTIRLFFIKKLTRFKAYLKHMVRVVFNDHMIWYNFLKKEFSLKSKSNKQNRMLSIVKHWVAHSCRANPIVDLRRRSQDIRCRYAVKGAIFYFFQFEETQHFHRFLQNVTTLIFVK